ncbi:MAG TPA: AMP-binding protein [Spirochaetota bacterium]|nr:AMP-binding protein [Spirochaetota bacterium]
MDRSAYRRDIYTAATDICSRFSSSILFKTGSNTVTFGETLSRVMNRASFLAEKGYGKGDVIGILADNSPDWCITFLAICSTGGIALPLDINLQKESFEGMISSVKAKAVFTSGTHGEGISSVPLYDIHSDTGRPAVSSFRNTAVSCDDIAAMLFTSGTTGSPKIVQLTHANLLHIASVCTELEEYTQNDVTLAMLPFFHVYALEATFLAPFVTGSMIVLQNSLKGPDIMKSLADNPVTIFPAAPLMWELFFNGLTAKAKAQSEFKYRIFMFFVNNAPLIKAAGLGFILKKIFRPVHDAFGHSHRFFISGGAPLKQEIFRYYKNMGFNIMEGYGLSETTGPIAIPYYKKSKAGSVGAPIGGNEVMIKNTNDDGIGEIWLRGDAVMPGYFNNDEANSTVFDNAGFFNTGDLGRVDRKGNIYVTGRVKNVIVLESGKKVYPEELEFYFRQSPLLAEIAIFDRPSEGRPCVYAVIVPAARAAASYSDIRRTIGELNRNLPEYKRIQRFALSIDDLPKNTTRKILYSDIRALLDQGMYQENEIGSAVLRQLLTGENVTAENIISHLKTKLKTEKLYHNQTLADFNIDSLRFIELVVYLEQVLGVQINTEEMRGKQNLGELTAWLATLEKSTGQLLDERILKDEITTGIHRFFNPMHHVVLAVFKMISVLLWRVSVTNPENLVIENNLIIANHQSYLDIVWIAFSIPVAKRKDVYATGKRKLSFLKFIFPVLPIIYIDDNNSIEVLKAGADILRSGKTLIVFPEGTRTDDGLVHTFLSGAAYLAKNLDKKIVPISVNGAYSIWPRDRMFPRIFSSHKGKLVVGRIINPEEFSTVESLNSAVEEAVRAGISA